MSVDNFAVDVANIAKLPDNPNTDGGLTAAQLKAEFDKAGLAIKAYINNTLVPQINRDLAAQITADKIPAGLITALMIDPLSVWPGSLDGNSVDTLQIKENAVKALQINSKAVTEDKIDDGAVTEDKIDDGAVTASKFGADVDYTTVKLNANQVRKIFAGTDTPVAPVEGEEPGEGEFVLNEGEIYLQYEEES